MYGLAVQAVAVNTSPRITSTPVFHAVADQPYEYQVDAFDPEGTTLTFTVTESPTGLTVDTNTGLITWIPSTGDLGSTFVTVTADDGELATSQRYSLNVTANTAPQLQLVTDKTVVVNTPLNLQVNAFDPDGDALTFSLVNEPAGMTINAQGLITWVPGTGDIAADPYIVTVTATDPYGLSASQDINILVTADQAPQVQVLADRSLGLLNEPIAFLVDAVDDLGLANLQLTINGQPVAIGIDRIATFTPTTLTDLAVTATATDTAGQTTVASLTLNVVDPNDLAAPDVTIHSPVNGAVLETPTDVVVTINDSAPTPGSTSVDYTLELRAAEDQDFRTIASGTGEVANAAIAQLDPTLLANGVYTLRLTATDAGGNASIATQTFMVDTRLKLGNFGLRFTDLTIPLAGIPIAVERAYDTLDALPGSTVEDFGQGWSLSVLDFQLQADVDVDGFGVFEQTGIAPPLKNGTRITVRLPDGSTAAFRAKPEPVDPITSSVFAQYGGINLVTVVFEPEAGTHTQTLRLTDDPTLVLASDGSFQTSTMGTPFNPASAGIDYVLESQDATAFRIDSVTGQLRDITDRQGNQIVVSQTGVTAVNPQGQVIEQITFTRDSQGRITKVIDPDGDMITYAYNAISGGGNLISVTNRDDQTVTMRYEASATFNQPHYLTSITDTRGVDVLTVNYDPTTGRLLGLTDASGAAAGFSYELGIPELGPNAFVEVVADANGVPTELLRDQRGNVIRRMTQMDNVVDAWQVEVFEYDGQGNQASVFEPFVATGRDRFTDVPPVQQSARSFDDRGNVLSETDAFGHTTTFAYDGFGNPTAIVDPLGNTTTNAYDNFGRLSDTTDAEGNVTRFGYDNNGNLTQVVQVDENGDEITQSQFNFDAKGQLLDSTDAAGQTRFFRYDQDGNQTLSYTHWEDPADGDAVIDKTVVSRTDYDEEGRVIATRQYTLTGQRDFNTASELDPETPDWSTSTTYDTDGRVLTSTDRFGNVSTSRYDARGNTVETRTESEDESGNTVMVVTRTAYDANGRVVATTDPFVENVTPTADIRVTHTLYDDLGRTVETRRIAGVDVTLADLGGGLFETSFDANYASTAILSASSTVYAGDGRVFSTTTPDGLTTFFQYDPAGRQTAVIQGIDVNQDGSTDAVDTDADSVPDTGSELIVTRFEYDAVGRQIKVTDPLGRVTESQYDALGRVIKTIQQGTPGSGTADNIVTETVYDALGRRIAAIDPLGQRTDFGYDNAGRLVSVTLPGVVDADPSSPTFNQTVRPVYAYRYDVYGNQTSITDPKGRVTTFTFDEQNRQISRTLPLGVETPGDPNDFTETQEYFITGVFFGLLQRTTDFEGRTTDFTYDSFGRLKTKTHTDPATSNTRTVTYAYDALSRTVEINDTGHGITTHEYDPESRLITRSTPEGTIRYEHDDLRRLTRTYTGADDTDHNSTASDGLAVTDTRYTYDELGRLQTVTATERFDQPLATPEVTNYRYDPVGNLDLVFLPNGIVTDYLYDDHNRLVDEIHYSPDTPPGSTPEDLSENAILTRFQYTVRADSNRTAVTETNDLGQTTIITWDYDALARLTEEVYSGFDAAGASLNYATTYTFDLASNRVTKTTDQGNDASTDEIITYTFDANDRLLTEIKDTDLVGGTTTDDTHTTYGYNTTVQTTKTITQGLDGTGLVTEQTTFEYDERGRMSKTTIDKSGVVTVTEYEYDDAGTRVSQTVTADGVTTVTQYLYDPQNHTGFAQILEEIVDGVLTKAYTLGSDVISQATTIQVLHLIYDGHGSTRAITDALAAVLERYAYDAYGNELGFEVAAAMTSLLYSGELTDATTGLQYLRARYYDPTSGRFIRLDPFTGNNFDPLSLHKYLYTHGNPVMGVDPSGEVLSLLANLSLRTKIGLVLLSITAPLAIFNLYQAYTPLGVLPTPAQQIQIDNARDVIHKRLVGKTFILTGGTRFTVEQRHATFNIYHVSFVADRWAHAPAEPFDRIVLNQGPLISNWFNLPPEEAATILIHELYHKDTWTPGTLEEDKAWELTALVWKELGLSRNGFLWADIQASSVELGFPLP